MSKIEVNQISSQCGSTLTIGQSGDTVTLACGATQTGFGRTGTVDWDTTAKTTNFTAVSGNGYFVNTTSGAITVTLPAGSAGAIVAFADYANTFDTNNLTIAPNGTDKIGGVNANATVSTEGASTTFVYVDSTQGWKQVNDATLNTIGAAFIIATGGTVTCCGDYKIHTFTGPGTFCVSQIATSPANNEISYMVVAGGGGGGDTLGGAGGAGGFREYKSSVDCYTASPLNGNPGGTAVTVTATAYPITVGAGGSRGPSSPSGSGCQGSNSVFSTITSTGGGSGGRFEVGGNGGSGGGGHAQCGSGAAGLGNTPPVSPPQGNNGGPNSATYAGGAGGGATAVGSPQPGPAAGGAGAGTAINPSCTVGTPGPNGVLRYFAGGGGGSRFNTPACSGSVGPGGVGGGGASIAGPASDSGTANTGGGGGGASYPYSPGPIAGSGGSGIVIIRYKYK